VRSYEPVIVSAKSGDEFSGVLRKDSADEVVLATGPNTEQHISRSDISDIRPGTVSVMPSGLADQLSKQEVADLLAFLKARGSDFRSCASAERSQLSVEKNGALYRDAATVASPARG